MAGTPDDSYPDLPDATPAPLRPSDVSPLVEEDIGYILDGDGYGNGGHRYHTAIPGKREFPEGWDEAKVREVIEAALWGHVPRNLSPDPAGVLLRAIVDNIVIAVPIRDFGTSWEVATAFPLSGDGVYKNVAAGQRESLPLNLDDFLRTLGE